MRRGWEWGEVGVEKKKGRGEFREVCGKKGLITKEDRLRINRPIEISTEISKPIHRDLSLSHV